MTDITTDASIFDVSTKLQEGEPYFMLAGRDRLAPPLVLKWAEENRQRALAEFAGGKINVEKRDRELRKSRDAEARAWQMEAFKAGDMVKKVAQEEPTAKTYTGAEVPEETKQKDRVQTARNKAATALNNAIAEMVELQEVLENDGNGEGLLNTVALELKAMRRTVDKVMIHVRLPDRARDMDYVKIDD